LPTPDQRHERASGDRVGDTINGEFGQSDGGTVWLDNDRLVVELS
jgi:hypothetical protein